MHKLIEKTFATPLGVVNCGLSSSEREIEKVANVTYENGKSEVFRSAGFLIELIEIQMEPCTRAWIWRLSKNNKNLEDIKLHFDISKFENVKCGPASGEGLDAIEAYTDDDVLHLGTEAGDALHQRAGKNNGFPKRFFNEAKWELFILEYEENGLVSKVPTLRIHEDIYLHYICSFGKSPEEDFSTWTKVDLSKRWIENCLGKRLKEVEEENR